MEISNNLNINDKDLKIKFIKETILDQNYNDFISFCLSKKEGGDKINNWSFEEIKSLVHEFNKNIKNNLEEKDDETLNIENEIEEMKKNDLLFEEDRDKDKENNFKKDKNKIIKRGKKEKIIKCVKLEKTILNEEDITININNPKEINGGLFSQNYILYTIEIQPINWEVQRKYEDFCLLREILIKHFPFHKIAPLPNKKKVSYPIDKNMINKRIDLLNNFINNIIRNETFKASEILISFLSIKDRKQLELKFKEYNNQITGNENLEEYKELSGELIILYDEKNENYFNNIKKYLKLQDEMFNKLNHNLKLFYQNVSSASENLNEIINNLGILHTINTNVLMKETITKTYEELQNLFIGWKKITIKQNNIVKSRVKNFFKYINLLNNSYKDILEKREALNNKFISENKKLKFKKESLFLNKDINKFEIDKKVGFNHQRILNDKKYAFRMMCTTETNNIMEMYKILGYGNKMAMTELKEMIKENCNKYIENMRQFEKDFSPTINEFSEIWNNFVLFTKDMNNKKNKNHKYKSSNDNNDFKNLNNNNIINIDKKLNINTNIISNNI